MFTADAANEVEREIVDAADEVDLDVEFTPVITQPGSIRPRKVHSTAGGEYYIVEFAHGPERVHAARLVYMRARYLCTRAWFVRNWHLLSESERKRAVAAFDIPLAGVVNKMMRSNSGE